MGSTPTSRTTFTEEIGASPESRADSAQNPAESGTRKVKFPQIIKHRKSEAKGKPWTPGDNTFQIHFPALCRQLGLKRKPNGLRHAFCTYHFAVHANENLTAAQAGNSPAMIHAHYKGLATKAEAGDSLLSMPLSRHTSESVPRGI